jgi:hypothetical protein
MIVLISNSADCGDGASPFGRHQHAVGEEYGFRIEWMIDSMFDTPPWPCASTTFAP